MVSKMSPNLVKRPPPPACVLLTPHPHPHHTPILMSAADSHPLILLPRSSSHTSPQVALRQLVSEMSPQAPQPPCLAVYAAEFAALDVGRTGRLPADLLVELLASDKWDLTDVEVRSVCDWAG